MGMTMAGLRAGVEIPLSIPLYGIRHLKNIRDPDRAQGRPSQGAGNELLAPCGGHPMTMLVTHPRSRSATT